MSKVSYRAIMAFTNACAEWIVHRLILVSDDPEPCQHLEASWAGVIDPWYALYWEPPDEEWAGPIRGALQLAIIFTLEARMDAHACADPARSADYASNLAAHIQTNPQPFHEWREHAVMRLEHLYPFTEDDPMGDVVPREALDPDFDFQPDMTEKLIEVYLNGLNPASNRFLRAAQEMTKSGFKGVPYHFDLRADRAARNAH
jgi:hypothetical protein